MLLAAACHAPPTGAGVGRVTVSHLPKDTVRFEVPTAARRCGAGLLFVGQRQGYGLLIWFRDSVAPAPGSYPLVPRGDTLTLRGARASIRWMTGDVAHGITIDAGTAVLESAPDSLGATVQGLGVETTSALQHEARVVVHGAVRGSDSADCRVQP